MSRHPRIMAALVAACVLPMLLAGCASAPLTPKPQRAGPDEWTHNPLNGIDPAERGKVFVAVGVSADKHNVQMTRRTAEADARNKLAETIMVQVDAMLKDWMAAATDYVKPENSASKQFTESVSRQVTSVTILGSTPRQYYDAPDGYTYVLMTAPRDDEFYRTMIEQTRKRLQAMGPLERKQLIKTEPDKAVESLKQHLHNANAKKPEPEKPIPQPPKTKPAKIAPTTAGPVPAWLQTGKHPDYPDSAYILGVGTRTSPKDEGYTNGLRASEADAKADIGRKIRVRVQQVFTDTMRGQVARKVNAKGQAHQTSTVNTISELLTKTEVDVTVLAAQVVGRYYDPASRTHYCLCAANRAKWAEALAADIAKRRTAATKHFDEATVAVQDANFMLAIQEFFHALEELVAAVKSETTLMVVAPPAIRPAISAPEPKFKAADVVIWLDRLLTGMRLEVAGGDKQRGSFGKPLPQPLQAKLVCTYRGKRAPGANATIRFTPKNIDPKFIALQTAAMTNANGVAECHVTRTDYDKQSVHVIEAAADFASLFPGAKGMPMPKATFTYYLRTPSTMKIAVKIFESADRKPLSQSFVESKIAEALTQAGFQVVDPTELAKALPNASRLRNANDKAVVAALGKIADVAVVGTVSADFKERAQYGPRQVIFYQGRKNIRVIDLNNGDVLATLDKWGQDEKAAGLNPGDAIRKTLRKVAESTGPAIADAVRGLFK